MTVLYFETAVNVALFVSYTIITLIILFQIGRILYNKHNIFSFRFGFLVLGLLWGIMRTLLWLVIESNSQMGVLILFSIPINIQFATFSLLVLFYAHVVHRHSWERVTKKRFTIAYCIVNVVLLILQCVWIALNYKNTPDGSSSSAEEPPWIGQVQSILTGIVFLLLVSILAFYGWRLNIILKTTKSQQFQSQLPMSIIPITFFIFLCFFSRCIFDFVSAFGIGEINLGNPNVRDSITIIVSYFVWEIIPFILILILFWRIPTTSIGGIGSRRTKNINNNNYAYPQPSYAPGRVINQTTGQPSNGNLARLFLDPQRYDSDDETTSLVHKGQSPVLYSGRHSPYSTTPISGSH
ncbi:hypothetical protein DLAC_07012 [Tieghemostelium lacteum]|uniref:THH1/TOM1/TOM3 domain-containing protein n=1 Tax=Tieghemostelium lacteum TaxID=361077 RepID=A0A151ZDZ8_TIELA|nr:hypothetical protein DLAC_07012 [Tieghemostelium lacteum]|eukprot:KYQ92171.1 hypothetical protein DLAC_07012 [Tieghemostelium lacteum]